jgi:hypothetical protein
MHPIQTAEYAKIISIDQEQAFKLCVPHLLRKRDSIISLVRKQNPCYLKRTHKFGIKVPKTVKEALELDRKNCNIFWADTIANKMKDVCIAFQILLDGQSTPIGYQKIPCHVILTSKWKTFDAKPDLLLVATRPKPQQ